MVRLAPLFACLGASLSACVPEDVAAPPEVPTTMVAQAASLAFSRQHVTADIYHYELVLPVGTTPNAALRLHRIVREVAPFVPRRAPRAILLLHGDFSTFVTNFAPTLGAPASPAPGMAPFLAAQGLDVWGVDRRWTLPGADDAVSDFGAMGVAQEVADVGAALAFARATRLATGSGGGRIALGGFSHGAQLAYAYAAVEGGRPATERHLSALVPIDWYGELPPDEVELRESACANAAWYYPEIEAGYIDGENSFQIDVGELALSAPDAASPFHPRYTNRTYLRYFQGQTYKLGVRYAPYYHLLSAVIENEVPVALRETSDLVAASWLAGATPHQATRESADFEALLCGEGPQPIDAPLSQIAVPVFYLGAAGGIGSLGLHTTTQLASTDVTTLIVQRFGPEHRAIDFGHSDLLFATEAPSLAWQPLARWLAQH